jgi:ubiquinone/menaquinone biosynthesis C-methylase UbiE
VSFDLLAPHYRWMEWLLAGEKLQRCRTAFLSEVQDARHVLLLGEGNGRFLSAFVQVNRFANITVLDASKRMLEQARRRMAGSDSERHEARINYIHADVLEWEPPARRFDLIVTNFFFDCFPENQLAVLVPQLARAAHAEARWIVSDFRVPPRGLSRWRAQWIIAVMYWFFRISTRLAVRSITPIDALLDASGFQLRQRRASEWGLLHTDLWQRRA